MYKFVTPSPEFLDSIGKATEVETDSADWILINVVNFGFFVSLNEEREKVYQINSMSEWAKEKNFVIKNYNPIGLFNVRNLFPKMELCCDPDLPDKVELYINAVVPEGMPVDKSKIRYEAYTNLQQAINDANDELNNGANVSRVHTVKVPMTLTLRSDNATK